MKSYHKSKYQRKHHPESKNYLNDRRFAQFWLNGRKINHSEGRTKLAAELAVRGISKEDSAAALDDFFETNNEAELCRKAYEKCLRIKKDPEKIIRTLISYGFQYNLIKKIMKSDETE